MRVILVPVANRPESARALDSAFELGARVGADVVGCHIRPHRESAVKMPSLLGGSGAEWTALTKGWNAEKLSADAQVLFSQRADRAGYRVARRPSSADETIAIWQERVGSPEKVMPIVGPMSDLLVLSRPAARGGRLAALFLMEALLHSCRPVLILPQKKVASPAENVLIAWNQSAEASRAVAMAMPLLRAATTVSIAVSGTENALGPKSSHLQRYLAHQGISASVQRGRGRDAAKEIETAYEKASADVVLMGAYSRSRLRELIFGGLTDHMLHHSKLPVLMYHSG